MRTSLNEIEQIESYLFEKGNSPDSIVVEAKLILDKSFATKIETQKRAYGFINAFGRNQLKKEIEMVHQTLFNHSKYSRFKKSILNLFSKS